MNKASSWIVIAMTAVLVLVAGCTSQPSAPANQSGGVEQSKSAPEAFNGKIIGLATLQAGSVNHAIGEALAKAISQHAGVQVRVEPSSGPRAWLPRMERGEIELGLASGFDVHAARVGDKAFFEKAYPHVRLVKQGMNALRGSVIIRDSSGIKSVADLAGKKVAFDAPHHPVVVTALSTIFAANGLETDQFETVRFDSYPDGVRAVIDGRADAALGSLGSGVVEELDAAHGARYLSMDTSEEGLARARQIFPSATGVVIKPGPTGVKEPTGFLAWSIDLVANKDLSPELVGAVAKALYEHFDDYNQAHPVMKSFAPDKSVGPNMSGPVHEGAVGFYESVGLWTEAIDQRHQELLK